MGLNPVISSGTQTLSLLDFFTGTLSITGTGSLSLTSNYTATLPLTFSGAGSYLTYSSSTRTLTIGPLSSLTRSGTGYTYVYNNLINNSTVTVSGGQLQFQAGTTFTNNVTTTVSGSGSTLYLKGLVNNGTIGVDSSGVVDLAGTYTTADLGTFNITTGGVAKLSGILTNTATNLAAPSSGAFTLYGGTITGGTIDSAALKFSGSGGILDGAVISGNLSLPSGQSLTLKNAGGFTGTATITDSTLYIGSNLTAAGGSAYVFMGSGSYLSYQGAGPFTLTLPSTASLTRSGTGYTYVYDNIANAGTVTVSGGQLQFQSNTTFSNAGTTSVTGSGSTLYLYGLANTGSLVVDSLGLIQLVGTYTTANLGSFTISNGGVVKLNGVLTNTAANLAPPVSGAFTLSGGTITGGTIDPAALIFSSSGGVLDGAVISGNLSLPSGQSLTFKNAGGLTGTATLNDSTLYLGSNLTAAVGSAYVFTGSGSYLSYQGAGPFTFTLPAGTSLTRSGTGYTYVYDNVANAGTVTVSGGQLQFQSNTTFSNAGTATVTGSGSTLYLYGLANTGSLIADSLGLIQLVGSYTTANLGTLTISNGGVVKLNGTLTNTSTNLTAPTGGAYTLSGGTITGGTIDPAALIFSSSGGILDGAVISGNLSLTSGQGLTLKNAGGFTGTATLTDSTLYLGSNLTAAVGSAYVFTGSGSYLSYQGGPFTLTLPAGASLTRSGTGYTYVYDNVANAGTVAVSGGQLQFQLGTVFTNTGTTTVAGAGSTLYLYGLSNSGSLVVDNSALLQLAGSYTTANLGVLTVTNGGLIKLSGSINNASANLTAPVGGTIGLYGGTITGGTIASGALTFTSSGGSLNNTNLLGSSFALPASTSLTFTSGSQFTATTLDFGGGSTFNWNQSGALDGKTITAGTGSGYAYFSVGAGKSLTFGSATTLSGVFDFRTGTGASFTNFGALNANAYTSYLYGDNTVNSGTLLATNGATLYLGYNTSDVVTNTSGGVINVSGTSSRIYLQNIVNQGTIQAQNNGVLYFQGGTNTTASLGTVQLGTGGRALLGGTYNNATATLNAPSGGMFELYGATLNNGTIAAGALTFTSSGGTLNGVAWLGDFTLPASTYVTLTGNSTIGGTNLTLGAASILYWNQSGTIAGQTLAAGNGTSYANVRVGSGYNVTLGSTSTLTGIFDFKTETAAAFTNLGTINASSGTSYLYGTSTTNSGNITTSAGASLYLGYYSTDVVTNSAGGTINAAGAGSKIFFQNPINQGTLSATAGGSLKLTGSFTTANLGLVSIASGGLVELVGNLDNTSSLLNAPTGGAFTLAGGAITGGTIDPTALIFSSSGGTLDGAVITGNATLSTSQSLTLKNAAGVTGTLSVNNGTLYLGTNLALSSALVLSGSGSSLSYTSANRTLTINSGGSLTRTGTGYSYNYDPIVNAGAVSIAGGAFYSYATFTNAGGNLTVATSSTLDQSSAALTQTAGTLVVNGQLTTGVSGLAVSGGSVSGNGTITGNVAFTGGTLSPGNPTGTLQLLGSLTLGSASNSVFELGAGSADRITGIGALTLGGQLDIIALTTSFTSGQTWNLFSASTITGSFSTINLPYTSQGWVWDTSQLATTGNLTLTTFVPVPEPSTYLLLAAGLGAIAVLHRRRRQR